MPDNGYICTVCFDQEETEDACHCTRPQHIGSPTHCVMGECGLCNWRCEHTNWETKQLGGGHPTPAEGVWVFTILEECTGCGITRNRNTRTFKLTEVE